MQVRSGFALDEVGDVFNFAGFPLRKASVHASSVGFALDEVGDVSNFAGFPLRKASAHASSVRLETAPTILKVAAGSPSQQRRNRNLLQTFPLRFP